jgi:hypothetical protein
MGGLLPIAHWLLIPIFLVLRLSLVFFWRTKERIWVQSAISIALIVFLGLTLYAAVVHSKHLLDERIHALDTNDDGVADRLEDTTELARLIENSFNGTGQLVALLVIPVLMLIIEILVTSYLLGTNRRRKQ